ncbi:MAG TPA: polyprenol monophosphomannose synthase [Gaiellaceae bacterium]|nr:polyprenol monophosphomannose synthase [Gaiellaceae bacterium]
MSRNEHSTGDGPRAIVCLPTYNERENLEQMVVAVGEVLDTTRDRLLVIDDGSPDGTGEIADRLADEFPWVSVLHRERKQGLGPAYVASFRRVLAEGAELAWVSVLHRDRKEGIGPAYVAGFRRALEDDAELVLEMDCDFSHDPADLRRLIAATEDADLALGSRYTPGGGTENWGLLRRFVSRGGCLYAQIFLGVHVRDLTGGFKCFRRAALEAIDLDALSAHGYAFQIETTYRVLRAGLRVKEIPIRFVERRAGASKMNTMIVVEAAWKVPLLRLRALTGRL